MKIFMTLYLIENQLGSFIFCVLSFAHVCFLYCSQQEKASLLFYFLNFCIGLYSLYIVLCFLRTFSCTYTIYVDHTSLTLCFCLFCPISHPFSFVLLDSFTLPSWVIYTHDFMCLFNWVPTNKRMCCLPFCLCLNLLIS